ncbi:endonuclease/exonuclease/phosphatase family protein [Shewanella litorisediminis]|uniref:Endonuclease/exonuclease/phosphatase family protein n=1 Tax=Shewanella litorisediminis TaxID=1173586 RepID=A0ABX7G3E5_9GAMM|nr:endonuclease/exonuclease/phosphatase family protein [Shewanella litorisediminis]MCL2919920.1 endonuclease/exonuclease/phosphatase family protein [Shewanella litorisediminis]QRH01862.1 endonuclease/exonuclease/phosphatase family protein [Shewanella litorisediminis]
MTNKRKIILWLSAALVALLIGALTTVLVKIPDVPEVILSEPGLVLTNQGRCFRHDYPVAAPVDRAIDDRGVISMLVWNIHKQSDGEWPEGLWTLGADWQLMLFQEVELNTDFRSALENHQFNWTMMPAFRFQGLDYGVMLASRRPSLEGCGLLKVEPWIRLPKAALYSLYALSNGETLLVVNLHGINFDPNLQEWEDQLAPLLKQVLQHQGPVILAGDFNSWGERRSNKLEKLLEPLELSSARFDPDSRIRVFGAPLDWVFYRGLILKEAQSPTTDLSDHAPLMVWFELIPGSTSDGETPGVHQ